MVKREQVKPGTTIAVVKKSPGQPGPSFRGTLGIHERLEVLSSPFSKGGMNLVKVRRPKTDEEFDIIYAYVTNFCKVVDDAETIPAPPPVPTDSPPSDDD